MFLIQRIHEGAGEDGEDIRETLAQNLPDPDKALAHLKKQFKAVDSDPDIEVKVTYNSKTRRFSIIPIERQDLLYHIVKKNEEDFIDAQNSNS